MQHFIFDLINDNIDNLDLDYLETIRNNDKTRFYCINNMYLSGIQAGIQSAHAMMEMVNKYLINQNGTPQEVALLKQCIRDDKTMVVLNGGHQSNLQNILNLFTEQHIKYPHAPFYEDDEALNGAFTNLAMVLPETLFLSDTKSILKEHLTTPNNGGFSNEELFQREIENANTLYLEKVFNGNSKIIKKYNKLRDKLKKIFVFSSPNTFFNFIILPDRILITQMSDFILLNEINKLRLMN